MFELMAHQAGGEAEACKVSGPRAVPRSTEFGDKLDPADNVTVELVKVFRRDPILDVLRATDLVHLVRLIKAFSTRKRRTKPAPELLTFQSRAICVAYSSVRTG
jgi:hypothetical protein